MKLIDLIKSDLRANKGNRKGQLVALSYRLSNHIYRSNNILVKLLGFPIVKFHHWFVIWIMGVEIPAKTRIGEGLQVWHGTALVINQDTVIGDNVLLRHSTTIGNKYLGSGCPVIGNNVEIGAHSILIGDIKIGDNVTIGAASLVTKSIPSNSVAYGNPIKIVSKFKETA
ncbi:serine acetyltransferase [Dyadobacter sp. NIV53]|uniref:serine acetyltransferase n=1 Tax=Dyadobacter sp. NIV53 TaxID=2861765 RepID=UPI001C877C63|nr:serine acetyltransferase [Dyadobacter sp. NIV53]